MAHNIVKNIACNIEIVVIKYVLNNLHVCTSTEGFQSPLQWLPCTFIYFTFTKCIIYVT